MIANISSSVITTGMHNTNNQHFCRNGIIVNSLPSNPTREECWRVNCSNPVITCIVATVLPITITSLLICGFMMQKNNLHEYAIYTFVIFCLAFIFPFALFFFTVIVHKIFKFYKRFNNDSEHNYHINDENIITNIRHNHSNSQTMPSLLRYSRSREFDCEYSCEAPYRSPHDYTLPNNRVFVNLSSDHHFAIEDSPPSYSQLFPNGTPILQPTIEIPEPIDIEKQNNILLQEKETT